MAEQQPNENNQQVAVRDPRPLQEAGFTFVPQTWEQLYAYAKEICSTEFVPNALRGKPGAVLAAWQTGKEVGLPPMASLQSIGVINGRPSIHSNGYWALITSHPLCEWFIELPPDEALQKGYGECSIKRRGNPHVITRKFHMHEAKTAGLVAKDNWKNYPGDMLQNRARHRCGDDAIPEATHGLMPSDVARDLEPADMTTIDRPQIKAPQPLSEAQTDRETGRLGDKETPEASHGHEPRARTSKGSVKESTSHEHEAPKADVEEPPLKDVALKLISGFTKETFPDPDWISPYMKAIPDDKDRLAVTTAYNEKKKALEG